MSDTVYKVWLNVERINEKEDLYEEATDVETNGEEYLSLDEARDVLTQATSVGKGCVVLNPKLVEDLKGLLTYSDEEENFKDSLVNEDMAFSRQRFGRRIPLAEEEKSAMSTDELAEHCEDHVYGQIVRLQKAMRFLEGGK